jgi:hypothetical protein
MKRIKLNRFYHLKISKKTSNNNHKNYTIVKKIPKKSIVFKLHQRRNMI